MSILDHIRADEAITTDALERYQSEMEVLGDELVFLHSNLSLVRQIDSFDEDLFEAPTALLKYLSYTLFTESSLICCRLWKDRSRGNLTLERFAKWFLESAIRNQYRDELRNRLQSANPPPEVEATIESLRDIRHARLAHLDHDIIRGFATRPKAVSLEAVQEVANALGDYFNAMSFGHEQLFVLIQFHSGAGAWHEGELGYILDLIAQCSKWLTAVDEYPGMWAHLREGLTPDQLGRINAVRARHNKDPLV